MQLRFCYTHSHLQATFQKDQRSCLMVGAGPQRGGGAGGGPRSERCSEQNNTASDRQFQSMSAVSSHTGTDVLILGSIGGLVARPASFSYPAVADLHQQAAQIRTTRPRGEIFNTSPLRIQYWASVYRFSAAVKAWRLTCCCSRSLGGGAAGKLLSGRDTLLGTTRHRTNDTNASRHFPRLKAPPWGVSG